MKKLTNNECILLGLIAEAPRYGYQLEQVISERGMQQWTEIAFSSIYYLLAKLEKEGLCNSESIANAERPARKLFHLSEVGIETLRENILRRLAQPHPYAPDFAIGLAFSAMLESEAVRGALDSHRQQLCQTKTEVAAKYAHDRHQGIPPHVSALFERSLMQLQTELDWLEIVFNCTRVRRSRLCISPKIIPIIQ